MHDFQIANTATIMTLMFMADNVYFSTEETQVTLTMDHQPSPSAIPIRGMMYVCIYLCGNRGLYRLATCKCDVEIWVMYA